jgi:hypothetical protein
VKALIGDDYMERVRSALGTEAYDAAFTEGRSMSLTDAVRYALEAIGPSGA